MRYSKKIIKDYHIGGVGVFSLLMGFLYVWPIIAADNIAAFLAGRYISNVFIAFAISASAAFFVYVVLKYKRRWLK